MRLRDLIREGIRTVSSAYPESEAREMVFCYLQQTFGIRKYDHILDPEMGLSPEQTEISLEAFGKMSGGMPLQYVTGKADFYGRRFDVSASVLIPRPETELLCRRALDHIRGRVSGGGLKVMDLCTGSGCIAWTMAMECVGAQVVGVDISCDALSVASGQNFTDGGSCRPSFVRADILCGPEDVFDGKSVDVLLSNPPYVMESEKSLMRPNVLEHEPHLALFVPDEDPLVFYRAVARWADYLLRDGGYGLVEINEALGGGTAAVFETCGFSDIHLLKDLNDRDRFVEFRR